MPLYDFSCPACGDVFEDLCAPHGPDPACPGCGGQTRRLVSVGRGYRADADWIASVTRVVDKDNPAPHVRAFLADPSRAAYRAWMRGERLRPLEPGEGIHRKDAAHAACETARRETLRRFAARRLGAA
jgi:putative FmdB family regulatory protein